MTISVKWTGEYKYGGEYPEIEGTTVAFEIQMTEQDGIISGTCIDEDTKEIFKDPIKIKGFIDGNVISFIKTYPYYYFLDKDGKIVIDNSMPPHSVSYSGSLNDRKDSCAGDWEITADSQTFGEFIIDDIMTGTWKMEKRR